MLKIRSSLAAKTVLTYVIAGAVPLAIVAVVALVAAGGLEENVRGQLAVISRKVADTVDRNLYERYGDAQAFGLNTAVRDTTQWYRPDSALVSVIDTYSRTYAPVYSLMLLVDTTGKVIAVNAHDHAGAPLATADLYARSFADASWFKALAAGQSTTSMPHSAPENSDENNPPVVLWLIIWK